MADTRSIDKTIRIRAAADAVWKEISEAEGITRWFAPEARVTPGPDGRIFISWGPGMEGESKIVLWDPPRHLRTEPGHHRPGMPLYIDYFVGPDGDETTVRLVHSGFGTGADWDEELDSYDRGWTVCLHNLRHAAERHPGRPCLQSIFAAGTKLSREDAWARLVERSGLVRDGDEVRLRTPALTGHVDLFVPGRDLSLVVPALDDARLNLGFERGKDGAFLYGVLLTYGVDRARAEAVRAELQALVDSL